MKSLTFLSLRNEMLTWLPPSCLMPHISRGSGLCFSRFIFGETSAIPTPHPNVHWTVFYRKLLGLSAQSPPIFPALEIVFPRFSPDSTHPPLMYPVAHQILSILLLFCQIALPVLEIALHTSCLCICFYSS